MMVMKKLWEILVPVTHNHGVRIKKKYHRKWDIKVSKIAGGLTILKAKKGRWLSGNQLFAEKMIPVRVAATAHEMELIANLTAEHYEQKAVMYYLVSELVSICEF